MILTNTYTVKQSFLRMHNPSEMQLSPWCNLESHPILCTVAAHSSRQESVVNGSRHFINIGLHCQVTCRRIFFLLKVLWLWKPFDATCVIFSLHHLQKLKLFIIKGYHKTLIGVYSCAANFSFLSLILKKLSPECQNIPFFVVKSYSSSCRTWISWLLLSVFSCDVHLQIILNCWLYRQPNRCPVYI